MGQNLGALNLLEFRIKKPRISPEKPGPQSSKIFADLLLLCSPHDTLYLKIENHFDNSAYTTRNGGI